MCHHSWWSLKTPFLKFTILNEKKYETQGHCVSPTPDMSVKAHAPALDFFSERSTALLLLQFNTVLETSRFATF